MNGNNRKPSAGRIAAIAVPAILILLFLVFRDNTAFSLWVTGHISRPYRRFMGRLTSPLGFSVMELLCTAAVIWVLVYIIITAVRLIKGGDRLKTLLRRAVTLITVAAWIFALFGWSYGFDYSIPGFAERNGFSGIVTTEKLYAVTGMFAENASRLAPLVDRDENGSISANISDIFNDSAYIYANLEKEFPELAAESHAPKGMLYSRPFSRMGFSGVYFPFTGECNINIDAPLSGVPFTVAHELAHSRGVASEDEANFVGIAACLSSGNDLYEYSGYLSGLTYLMNDLYRADRTGWQEIVTGLDDLVLHDMVESNAYWRSFRSSVTEAAETVYSGYLKVGGDARGIMAYDECVRLLVEYYGEMKNSE
jgi:hypothetical protein